MSLTSWLCDQYERSGNSRWLDLAEIALSIYRVKVEIKVGFRRMFL